MFTGIVDHCGEIKNIESFSEGFRLSILSQFPGFTLGESIAVDGICLTVTKAEKNLFYCDLSPETCHLTTAKHFKAGQFVNLEKALTLNALLGGHVVTGHVDTEITAKEVFKMDTFWKVDFEIPHKTYLKYLVKKGSIALNGVSLTVNDVHHDQFSVMIIPHTLEKTNLRNLTAGKRVNAEWDYFARYLINYLEKFKEPLHE